MSKPRALVDLMTAVDAGLADDVGVNVDSANFAGRRHSRSRQNAAVAAQTPPSWSEPPAEASFEFSAAVSNSSASPASMVFSDGQLRAHQFPAVRSASEEDGSQAALRLRSSSMTGSKKRVSFEADGGGGAGKAAAKSQRKGGGLLGCMGSACGLSCDQVVEPAMNANRNKDLSV